MREEPDKEKMKISIKTIGYSLIIIGLALCVLTAFSYVNYTQAEHTGYYDSTDLKISYIFFSSISIAIILSGLAIIRYKSKSN